MKTIVFKKLPKNLIEEGISIELLNKVQLSNNLSPVMFQPGDEPVKLVKCNKEFYWVLLDDGTFLKDANGLIKFDLKTCIIARARYWLLFSDKEIAMDNKRKEEAKQKEIQQEMERIKTDLKQICKTINNKYSQICLVAETRKAVGFEDIYLVLQKNNNPDLFAKNKEAALSFLNDSPRIQETIDNMNLYLEKEDYDSLYIMLKTNGLPLLISGELKSEGDMFLINKFFSKAKIGETIENISNKSHIENVAMLSVNRRYV